MALSGSISTSSYEGRIYTLSWSATQSIQNNQSTISWTLSCSGGVSWFAERTLEAAIAGKTVFSKTERVERYAGVISSGSTVVDHDVQGNYSFSAAIRVAIFGSSVNRTASGSFTLDKIPRQATITSVMDFNDVTNPTIYFNHPAGSALELQACIMSGDTMITSYRQVSAEDIANGSYTFNLKEPYDDGTTPESRIWDRSIAVGRDTIDVTFRLATWLGSAFGYTDSETKKCVVTDCEPQLSPTITDVGTNSTRLTGGDTNKIIKGHNYLEVTTGAVAYKKASIVSQSISCGGITKYTASGSIENVESNIFIFTATDNRGKTVTTTLTKELIDYEKLTCNVAINNPTPDGTLDILVSGNYFNGNFGAVNNNLIVEYRLAVAGQNLDETQWFRSGTNIDLGDINLVSGDPVIADGTYSCTVNVSGLDYRTTYIIQARAADEVYTGYLITSERAVRCMPVFDWGPDDFKFNVPINVNDFATIDEEVDINVPLNVNDGADISGAVNIKGPTTITDDVYFEGGIYKDGYQIGHHPVGEIYMTSTNTNPGELFGGTWQLVKSFYGGELLAYGSAWNAITREVAFAANTTYGISDCFPEGVYTGRICNYVPNILTSSSGTIWVQTGGVVGLVETTIELGGVVDSGCTGIWFRPTNKNQLPESVVMTGGGTLKAVTGSYSGASSSYFYNVANDDSGTNFFVNPEWMPYGGSFKPCGAGINCNILVKAYAKGGTTYMWKRTA